MFKKHLVIGWCLVVGLLGVARQPRWAEAAQVDVEALLSDADRARGGGLPGIVWTVDVEARRDGESKRRLLRVSAQDTNSLVEFLKPMKVSGQRMLQRGQSLWFSRPGLQKPVPLSPRQRLLGDAANGDIAATNYAGDYRARLLGEAKVGGEECYELELSAAKSGVTYDKIKYFVSKSRKLGLKAEFFSVSGKLFKVATFQYGSLTINGEVIPFITEMTITDAITPSASTVLRYSDVAVRPLSPSVFSVSLLSR